MKRLVEKEEPLAMQTYMPGHNQEHAARVQNQSTAVTFLPMFHFSLTNYCVGTQTHGCAGKCTSSDKEFGSSLGGDILPSDFSVQSEAHIHLE